MKQLILADKLCDIRDPLNWTEEKQDVFVEACRELAIFHYEHSREIKFIYDKRRFDPLSIRVNADITRIPMVNVAAMKSFLLISLPQEMAALKLTSSGTKGQKTQIWMDKASLDRAQKMLDGYWLQEGFISPKQSNYLVFNYDPRAAGDLGIAFTDENQMRFSPVAKAFYAIQKDDKGQWVFKKEQCLQQLKDFCLEELPVRIFGMPSFIYEFLELVDKPLCLPKGSLIITGGGWKAAEDKKISRELFRQQLVDALGISAERIRDAYGMAEHVAPYFECKRHRFHIPIYARIIIRDPVSLEVLNDGNEGLMELITPFNAMMPNLAVLSTDFGYINPDPCECGFNSPTFTLCGRAGKTKHKGCAITAHEIVRRA